MRRWVPELQGIKGGDVHTPWSLSSASLSHAGVCLGETYPTPVVTAPEWSRHVNKKPVGGLYEKGEVKGVIESIYFYLGDWTICI